MPPARRRLFHAGQKLGFLRIEFLLGDRADAQQLVQLFQQDEGVLARRGAGRARLKRWVWPVYAASWISSP